MPAVLQFCRRAYDYSLRFYPETLRESFGADMSDAFAQQMADAWAEGGWPMALRAIGCAFKELFTEALPALAGSQTVMAGAIAFVCNTVGFWFLLWMLQNPMEVKALGDRLNRTLWGG
jgi:hypothetical protein